MKRAILSLTLILCVLFGAQAQTQTVKFQYDAAGNRELRTIIDVNKITKMDSLFKADSLYADLTDTPINGLRVYPNPAHETVNIEFTTLPESKVEFTLSDMNGRLLEQGTINAVLTPLSLQNMGKGTYLLLIMAGNENEKFKIIKQ